MTASISTASGCLVTGAAGNLGAKLCQTLLKAGVFVVGVDNFFSGDRSALVPFEASPGFAFHEGSILEPGLLTRLSGLYGRFDAVLHMAAVVSVPWSMRNPKETMAVNFHAARALHEESRRLGVPAFVFAGSAAEYGLPVRGFAREDQAGKPRSPYGWAKFLASRLIERSGYGCSLRFFNLYGPTLGRAGPYDGVVRRFVASALKAEPLTVFGDGEQTRDFVYVFDAVRAVLLAAGLADGRAPLAGVYNVGTGLATTVAALAGLVSRLAGRDLPVVHLPERAGDLRCSLADASRLREAAGYTPDTALDDGLRTTMEWFARHREALI